MSSPRPYRETNRTNRIERSSSSDPAHPIRRVRDALKFTPEELGLRRYATSAGFAEFLGCSSSYVRNVECGITENWVKLAALVEKKTGVSSEWLLSMPGPEQPIMGIRNTEWDPVVSLDPLGRRHGMPDWRMLSRNCPDLLPSIAAKMVEEQLRYDLREGRDHFLVDLVRAFESRRTFTLIDLIPAKQKIRAIMEKGLINKAWSEPAASEMPGMNEILKPEG